MLLGLRRWLIALLSPAPVILPTAPLLPEAEAPEAQASRERKVVEKRAAKRLHEAEKRAADHAKTALAEAKRERTELQKRLADAEERATELSKKLEAASMPKTMVRAHFSPGDDCLSAICGELDDAVRTADVCVFTITDDRIAGRILDAHRRGVRVRIITDDDKAHDQGSDVRRLERAGIEVREDHSPFHMHHKFAVFDGRTMLTGSYNWTRGAAQNNEENLVVTDDARLIDAFTRQFEILWKDFAPRR